VAGAERPDVKELLAHRAQNRTGFFHVFAVAADHDRERRVLRLYDRAGHRGIEHSHAFGLQRGGEGPRADGIGRAHVDDERARRQRRQRFEHRFAHRLAVGQHGDQRIGTLRRLQRRIAITAAVAIV
jgi:hypothetical protein